jgi:putative heme-binding domain-containing protein
LAVREVIVAVLARAEAVVSLRAAISSRPPHADVAKLALRQMAAAGRRDEVLAASLETAAGFRRDARRWSPTEVLELIGEAKREGDPRRGAVVFQRPELGCVQCHGINSTVLGIGPDLGALGTAQTPEFIVGAILEPQREVKEGFFSVTLTLRDGDELTGRIVADEGDQLVIHDTLTRHDVRVRRDKIASRTDVGSVMPPGLADTLTRAEFRDLVRYLMSLGRREP